MQMFRLCKASITVRTFKFFVPKLWSPQPRALDVYPSHILHTPCTSRQMRDKVQQGITANRALHQTQIINTQHASLHPEHVPQSAMRACNHACIHTAGPFAGWYTSSVTSSSCSCSLSSWSRMSGMASSTATATWFEERMQRSSSSVKILPGYCLPKAMMP